MKESVTILIGKPEEATNLIVESRTSAKTGGGKVLADSRIRHS
jgi:hypothetical protein